ncbi:hypothetical protein [Crateriforma conspicua]|uniref:hypothetical protein n=1 Tax=Crateriforma TaxID=2714592 RepID=UPI0011B78286|nr:hypothetical protein [Crateriforma conspicua]
MPTTENPYRTPSNVQVVANGRLRLASRPTKWIAAFVMLPAIIMLALFYSLGIHMFQCLGGWPNSIGDAGFPKPLAVHAWLAQALFAVLALSAFFWPVLFLACTTRRKWQPLIRYLVVYAASLLIGYLLMSLAPTAFWDWWWD